MNGGEGRTRKRCPWGLPTVARPPASVMLMQAAPDPPRAHCLGTASQPDGRVGMLSVLSHCGFAAWPPGTQCSPRSLTTGYGREGGRPPPVPLIWGDPDMEARGRRTSAAAHPARGWLVAHHRPRRLFAGGPVAFVSWFTPKPEAQVTIPSLVGSSLLVSLWLGAALVMCVLHTHCLSLSLFF